MEGSSSRARTTSYSPARAGTPSGRAAGPRTWGRVRWMTELDPKTQERIDEPVSAEAERETRLTPAQAVKLMRIRVPERGNTKLRRVIERVNHDDQLKGWWHVANVNAV